VTHLIIRPNRRVFHRYTTDEMSGPLPPALFKFLPAVHARRLVEHGEMMWSTLTWFQNQEDPIRGDTSIKAAIRAEVTALLELLR
jgi:hypothetical protein